jgi:hypothetical protein
LETDASSLTLLRDMTFGAGFVYARSPRPMVGNDVAVLLGFLAAAIALAGFAGIVTSIDRGAGVASNEVISFRVSNLVTSAVASVFLSLLPVLLEALQLFPATLWQRCCVVSAVGIGALLCSLVAARLRMRGGKAAGLSHALFATNLTLGAFACVVLVAGASGAVAGRGAYFTGLFYLLYLMCTLFHRMVAMADAAASNAAKRKQ